MSYEHNEIQAIKKEFFEEADERYVRIDVCSERKQEINETIANHDKRIEIISHDFSVIKKLMWVIVSACISSLVVAFLQLVFK